MNPLLYLLFVGSASAGIVFWQQGSIDRAHKEIDGLSKQIANCRSNVESHRGPLAHAQDQLADLQQQTRIAKVNQADLLALQESSKTPAHEGWWPKDQTYFYLPKTFISQARFLTCRLPITEVNALESTRATDDNMKSGNVSISFGTVSVAPDKEGKGVFDFRLVDGRKLNRDMAALLGMNGEEASRVDTLIAGLIRSVHAIEVSRVEPLSLPEPDGSGTIVARIPELTEQVNPLMDSFKEDLAQCLGQDRAAILLKHAETYFDQHLGRLGKYPREFLRRDYLLIVRYKMKSGWYQESDWSSRPGTEKYYYLFGLGGPCEFK